jgi:nitrilase
MPLLRFSLYSQNVNLYLAPTADARETWVPLMQTIACEGRCFVLSANQCMRRKNLPDWIKEAEATSSSESKPSEAAADAPRKQARRSSIITRTEDNHEISWPSPETTTTSASKDYFPTTSEGSKDANTNDVPQKIPRRASVITRTEDNHEITWPSADAKPPTNPATATSHIANGFFPSPLRTSAVPNDNPATPSQQPLSHQNTPPQNLTTTNSDPSPDDPEELVSRGGSVIVSPTGSILAGPLWDVEDGGMLVVSVDFQDCERGRLDLDVAGSYSRQDAFKLEVVGLDISPPP